MTWQRTLYPLMIFIFLGLSLSGCGDSNVFSSMSDDNTQEARLDKSLESINSGDYQTAITTLEALNSDYPNDPDVERYLASAYVGQAGFDTLDLFEILSEDDEGGEDQEMFDTIGELFGADENGMIPALDDKIADVDNALNLLAPTGTADEDSIFQAGLYGAVQTVLLAVDILDGASMDSIKAMSDPEISDKVTANFDSRQSELIKSLGLLADTADDLTEKANGESNDLAEEMDQLLSEIGYDRVNKDLTALALTTYLQSLNEEI